MVMTIEWVDKGQSPWIITDSPSYVQILVYNHEILRQVKEVSLKDVTSHSEVIRAQVQI